jgi:hypothetical protein
MGAAERMRPYQVRIHYREPTYELYSGRKARPYSCSCTVQAQNGAEAKRLALMQFEELQRRSAVTWAREIVLVELDGGQN